VSHPREISPTAKWKEHKGTGANQDHGIDKKDFKDVQGIISITSQGKALSDDSCGKAGLTKIQITHAVTWKEAESLAKEEAGGLPTCSELRIAGVTAGDGVDLWMPVQREDGREGDFCQIGNHPINPQRYISHVDAFGMPAWYQNNNGAPWRPMTYFYAKVATNDESNDPIDNEPEPEVAEDDPEESNWVIVAQ